MSTSRTTTILLIHARTARTRTRDWISRQVNQAGQPKPEPRRLGLDTLRGLGIFLVVTLHASGDREVIAGTIYEYLSYSFDSIRLPMLTVVSGMVYGLRPVTDASWRSFATGKLRRLGLPFLTLTSFTVGLKLLAAREVGGVMALVYAFVLPYEHLWYLPALGWVMAIVVVLELRGGLPTAGGWRRAFVAALVLHGVTDALSVTALQLLSLAGALYLLPAFLLGVGVTRFPQALGRPAVRRTAAVIAVVGLATQQLVYLAALDVPLSKTGPLSVAVGLSSCLLAVQAGWSLPWLARLGAHSYPLYLLHGLAIALGMRVAAMASLSSLDAVFGVRLAFGLTVPLLAAWLLRRSAAARALVLGEHATEDPVATPGIVVPPRDVHRARPGLRHGAWRSARCGGSRAGVEGPSRTGFASLGRISSRSRALLGASPRARGLRGTHLPRRGPREGRVGGGSRASAPASCGLPAAGCASTTSGHATLGSTLGGRSTTRAHRLGTRHHPVNGRCPMRSCQTPRRHEPSRRLHRP